MKKNRVVKIMMSAAVMATVTTGTVMAKEPESGAEEGVAESRRPGQDKEEEAVYYAMNARQEGGPGLVEPDQAQKEPEEEEEYGPHCITLKKEEVPETPLLYTDEDLYVLAHAICGEGQCCPDEEQLYIGSVILNRRAWCFKGASTHVPGMGIITENLRKPTGGMPDGFWKTAAFFPAMWSIRPGSGRGADYICRPDIINTVTDKVIFLVIFLVL